MNTRMAERTLAKEHILKIIATFKETKVLGATIDPESQMDMVLKTLPDSFSQFKLNYNMNKIEMTPVELMKEFQIAKKVMIPQCKALVAKLSSSRTGPKPRNFKKKKKGNAVARPNT
jgi:hypothetical protein